MSGENDLVPRHRRSSHERLISAASAIGPEMGAEVTALLNGQGIGSRIFFGRSMRRIRIMDDSTLLDWSGKLGLSDPTILSRHEQGEHRIPQRNELIAMGILLKLPQEEIDDLMVSAGYIPETGFEMKITRAEQAVLTSAMSELLGKPNKTGFIEMLKNLVRK